MILYQKFADLQMQKKRHPFLGEWRSLLSFLVNRCDFGKIISTLGLRVPRTLQNIWSILPISKKSKAGT